VQQVNGPSGLHLAYVSRTDYRAAQWADVLGIATFNGTPRPANAAAGLPIAEVRMPVLSGAAHLYEVWSSGEHARSGQRSRVRFRRTEEMLFGCITLAESDVEANGGGAERAPPASALEEVTAQIYGEICATLDAEGYPHLVRIWNYLPDINRDCQGIERYRLFNAARQHGLNAFGRALAGSVPAASALGAVSNSPVVVYFLASRTAPVFVENPRQVSAYDYPHRYGTHRPVFSRAALLQQRDRRTLFISGTASIVGHESLHAGDCAAQTRETLANIAALLQEANRVAAAADFGFGTLTYKVYVRHPDDFAVVQGELTSALGPDAQALYLQADICRQELLVEIEATGICPLARGALAPDARC
jgi:enamine deaminase RidA (YjgF/YER057c/UK114 family)